MDTKECNKCGNNITLENFSKDSRNKDGLKSVCKLCLANYKKEYVQKNKIKIEEYNKSYKLNNADKIKQYEKDRFQKNKKEIMDKNKQYKLIHKERDRDKINKQRREYQKKRMAIDPLYRLRINIKNSITNSLKRKGFQKKSKTKIILGCEIIDFKNHIESQWEPWMKWDNYGKYNGELNYGWDIDHIIPTSSAITEEELIKLNHYTNLKPLCSKINRDIKRNKVS